MLQVRKGEEIKEDFNKTNTYVQNQKETTEISWGHNVKGGLGKFNIRRANQGQGDRGRSKEPGLTAGLCEY